MCAMKVFNVGDVLASADANEYFTNTRYISKPADTARTANTTLTADPDLTLALDANKSYHLEILVNYYNGGGTTGNLKASLSVPASSTLYGGVWGNAASGAGFVTNSYDGSATGIPGAGTITQWQANVSDVPVLWIGVLVTGASAGNVTVNWAQNASSATATTVRQGSWMFARRVA